MPHALHDEGSAAQNTSTHGCRSRYVAGCRCSLCREANRSYRAHRRLALRSGHTPAVTVDASAARRHILKLSRQGVGYRSVADACDVRPSTVLAIRTKRRQRIRPETEQRILEVTAAAVADHGYVDATPTRNRIAELCEEGFTKRELARRLGYKSPSVQLRSDSVLAIHALRISRLYNQVMS